MSYETYYTSNKTAITVESKPFGFGGEGNIHKIITPLYKSSCIKIYHIRHRTKEKENKISYMTKNPPPKLEDTMFRLCWPKELIYNQNGSFLGFLMPLAFDNSIQFYELTNLKFKKVLRNSIWENKFTRTTGDGLQNRLKVCVNISAAVYHVHTSQKYVFVDFKPQNILMNIQGKISITDLDSIQISTGNKVLYRSHVVTPEYTPKESEKYDPKINQIHETWDRFSLAVMFYENLFGLHPYVGTTTGQYAEKNTISEKIHHNLFPLGSKRFYFANPPKQHEHINLFPNSLKMLFLRAFEYSDSQKRPNAAEWGQELYSIINNPALKKKPIIIPNDIPKQNIQPATAYTQRPVPSQTRQAPRYATNTQSPKPLYVNSGTVTFFIILLICGFIFLIISQSKNSNNLTSEVAVDSTVAAVDSTITAIADSATAFDDLTSVAVDSTVTATADSATTSIDIDNYAYTQNTPTGSVLFWKGCNRSDDVLQVYIKGEYIGSLLKCYSNVPYIEDYGCVRYTAPSNETLFYTIKSLKTGATWRGRVELTKDEYVGEPIE